MIIENKYKEKLKEETIKHLLHLINNIKLNYPELLNRLSIEEIEIICDVFYNEFYEKKELYKYYECMDCLFANGLYSAILKDYRFNFECIKDNKLVLQKYFNYLEIIHILRKIEKRKKQEIKCKIIKMKIK